MLTVLPQPKIEIIQYDIDSVIGCDGTTYDLSVMFEYINLDGTALAVDLDGLPASDITPAFVPNSELPQTAIAKFEGLTADGATHTLTVKNIGGSYSCEASSNIEAPQDAKIELIAKAAVQPYACGDHTYSVKVEVEFANGQGRDLIIEDWKGIITQVPTTATDTKIDTILSYEKHTPGGGHRYRIYFYGNIDCYVTTQFTEPAQPKIDITDYTATAVTGCDGNTYDMTVTFEYTNQDGTLEVQLDGTTVTADIMPAFVQNSNTTLTTTATVNGLTADGLRHTLTVKTTGGEHNCEDDISVTAPQPEAIITSVEVTAPDNILCDQTEYDATVTVSMTSGNAIGKKIVITHEGINDTIKVTNNPMVTTVKMTTSDATDLTMEAYFDGHPECKVTSDPFNAPVKLSCVKDHEQKCQGEIYTWPVTNLTYGPFTRAGLDTFVNALNTYDTLFVNVHPVPTVEEATTDTTVYTDDLPYEWNGEWFSEPQTEYTKVLQTADGCDYTATLNLIVKENNVEVTDITIAKQCAGKGALEIVIQHTGLLDDARLTFDNKAIQAGFVDETYPIVNDIVNVPYNARAGIFSVNIDLLFHGHSKIAKDTTFTLLYPSSVLEQGWYDAIFVLTPKGQQLAMPDEPIYTYDFTEFQWYKNGQMLVGEIGPYLYQPLEVGAEYSAMLTDTSGLRLMTCPIIIQPFTEENPYPTLVSDRNIIRVSVTQNALLTIYSVMGQKVGSYSLIDGDTQINAPGTKGIYLAEFVFESGQRKVIKFMVR